MVSVIADYTDRDLADHILSEDSNQETLQAHSVAIQKYANIHTNNGSPLPSPGDILQFTMNFEVSDYFDFTNIVIEDQMPDGLTYIP